MYNVDFSFPKMTLNWTGNRIQEPFQFSPYTPCTPSSFDVQQEARVKNIYWHNII